MKRDWLLCLETSAIDIARILRQIILQIAQGSQANLDLSH